MTTAHGSPATPAIPLVISGDGTPVLTPLPPPAPSTTAEVGPAFPPSTSPGASSFALPTVFLLLLAAAALWLSRRQRRGAPGRLLRIVEQASLGPRRALVVARLGDELLVLGSSEAGVTLLATRPAAPATAPAEAPAVAGAPADPAPAAVPSPPEPEPPSVGLQLAGLLERLPRLPRLPGWRRSADASFDAALAESLEDLELRRKLAAGRGGSVP